MKSLEQGYFMLDACFGRVYMKNDVPDAILTQLRSQTQETHTIAASRLLSFIVHMMR